MIVWIPVSTKLPPTSVRVRVKTSDQRIPSGETIAIWQSDGYWHCPGIGMLHGVSHWASL